MYESSLCCFLNEKIISPYKIKTKFTSNQLIGWLTWTGEGLQWLHFLCWLPQWHSGCGSYHCYRYLVGKNGRLADKDQRFLALQPKPTHPHPSFEIERKYQAEHWKSQIEMKSWTLKVKRLVCSSLQLILPNHQRQENKC